MTRERPPRLLLRLREGAIRHGEFTIASIAVLRRAAGRLPPPLAGGNDTIDDGAKRPNTIIAKHVGCARGRAMRRDDLQQPDDGIDGQFRQDGSYPGGGGAVAGQSDMKARP